MTKINMYNFPIQPVFDDNGVARFRSNKIVRYLLDRGGLDLNKLLFEFPQKENEEDWSQFAQLIGYSVYGAWEVYYISNEIMETALKMYEDPQVDQKDLYIASLKETIRELKKEIRDSIENLQDLVGDEDE